MTNAEKMAAFLAIVTDATRSVAERLAAFEDADTLRKTMKTSWAKLGVEDPGGLQAQLQQAVSAIVAGTPEGGDLTAALTAPGGAPGGSAPEFTEATGDELKAGRTVDHDEAVAPAAEAKPKKAKKAKEPKPIDPNRGALTKLVVEQLMKPEMSYADIVALVKTKFPAAETTTRSIASVAADLRKEKGIDVPSRRKVAAPKTEKASA